MRQSMLASCGALRQLVHRLHYGRSSLINRPSLSQPGDGESVPITAVSSRNKARVQNANRRSRSSPEYLVDLPPHGIFEADEKWRSEHFRWARILCGRRHQARHPDLPVGVVRVALAVATVE